MMLQKAQLRASFLFHKSDVFPEQKNPVYIITICFYLCINKFDSNLS